MTKSNIEVEWRPARLKPSGAIGTRINSSILFGMLKTPILVYSYVGHSESNEIRQNFFLLYSIRFQKTFVSQGFQIGIKLNPKVVKHKKILWTTNPRRPTTDFRNGKLLSVLFIGDIQHLKISIKRLQE